MFNLPTPEVDHTITLTTTKHTVTTRMVTTVVFTVLAKSMATMLHAPTVALSTVSVALSNNALHLLLELFLVEFSV